MRKISRRKYIPFGIGWLCLFFISGAAAQEQEPKPLVPRIIENKPSGKFEVGIHYSQWTLDLIKGMFQNDLMSELGEEIRNEISNELRASHINLEQTLYEQDLMFDSGGHNYGLELRYYPKGREGSFSLGLSLEKAKMRLAVNGTVKQTFSDGSFATADASGEILLNPFFTHLSFRWDMMPQWRVTPYLVLGLGVAAMKGDLQYDYLGVYKWIGVDETVEDSDQKSINEAEEDMDFNIPNIFPLLESTFGIRIELMPNLHMKVGTGFWNGFIFRLGVSGRF